MGVIGACGRWTGKGRKLVHTTDDNVLTVSGCFFEKLKEYLGGDGKAGPQKTQFLKSYSTSRGAASPPAPVPRGQTPPSTNCRLLLRQVHFSDA